MKVILMKLVKVYTKEIIYYNCSFAKKILPFMVMKCWVGSVNDSDKRI